MNNNNLNYEELAVQLAKQITSDATEDIYEEVFQYVRGNNPLINSVVQEFVGNVSEYVIHIKEIVKAYEEFGLDSEEKERPLN